MGCTLDRTVDRTAQSIAVDRTAQSIAVNRTAL
jgi:hypothetical protein